MGVYGPNPLTPSATIVPEAMATSWTCEPQAAPAVGMSTPWSSDQVLGGSTLLSGLRGNTQPLGAPVPDPPPTLTLLVTSSSRAAAVTRPTTPSTVRLAACWKALTWPRVIGPK